MQLYASGSVFVSLQTSVYCEYEWTTMPISGLIVQLCAVYKIICIVYNYVYTRAYTKIQEASLRSLNS